MLKLIMNDRMDQPQREVSSYDVYRKSSGIHTLFLEVIDKTERGTVYRTLNYNQSDLALTGLYKCRVKDNLSKANWTYVGRVDPESMTLEVHQDEKEVA